MALPCSLQSLTFGSDLNQSMLKAALPGGLQSLTFGFGFNQDMEKVALPSCLQCLTLAMASVGAGKRWLCHSACRA